MSTKPRLLRWLEGAVFGTGKPRASVGPASRPAARSLPAGWPGPRTAAELLRATPELHEILARLGFLPRVEGRWPALMAGLEGSIEVEIPSYPALREELERIRASLLTEPAEDDLLGRARWTRRRDPLLAAVLGSLDEPHRVLWLLSRKPVREALPLIEEIPFLHQGQISWQRPMDIPLLRKRPRDAERFAELLDEVEGLLLGVPAVGHRGRQRAQRAALDALARLRRALERENAYLPAPLLALEARVGEWLHETRTAAAVARRGDLEEILSGLAEARHRLLDDELSRPAAEAWQERALRQAARYLDTPWMHTPWLTRYVLATLLATELARSEEAAGPAGPTETGSAQKIMQVVWHEVASHRFDAAESMRRLRGLEARGIHVHSLTYTLLKLSRRGESLVD